MEKYNKIYWKRGLEITPEIFITSDNYNTYQQNIIRRLCTINSYGILPPIKEGNLCFEIEYKITDNILYINNLLCNAITKQGYMIDIGDDFDFYKEIDLNDCINSEYYIILNVSPYDNEVVINQEIYAQPSYELVVKKADKINYSGIPILKISYSKNNCWEADSEYILPSISICSDKNLISKYNSINRKIDSIISHIKNDELLLNISMLKLELDNEFKYATPYSLVLFLKKTCKIFELFFKDKLEKPKYILEEYDHNNISYILNLGLEYLETVEQKLTEVVEIKPEPVADDNTPEI